MTGGRGSLAGMTPSLPVPLVSVSGTPAECGVAYGAAAADLVVRNVDVYRRRFAEQAGLDTAAVHAAGAVFREVTLLHQPRVGAMLDGVADGAGVPVAEIYALNARTELLYGAATGVPQEGADGACTSIGVLGTHTASGHLLLAQNWDWHPDQRGAMVLLRTTDERGHRVLTLAEAGMLAKAGVNSGGIGVCVNMLGCDRDGLSGGQPPGVPYHALLRAALDAATLAGALRATIRPPRNSSINLLLGQAGPEGGEVIDVEVVPGDSGWLHPVDGVVTHANHLESGLPVYDTIKDWGGSSLFRAARARRLLADAAASRKVTEDDIIAVLRDHLGHPTAICRHVDEQLAHYDRSETVHSVLLDLDDRRLGLTDGPPCGGDYTWVDLG